MSPALIPPLPPAIPLPAEEPRLAGGLLTEAEALALPANELATAAPLRCAEPTCAAPPRDGTVRVVMQEIHFTCLGGHWNALGTTAWQEAA